MSEQERESLVPVEKRIVQMHLLYPDTRCYYSGEDGSEIRYLVVVLK